MRTRGSSSHITIMSNPLLFVALVSCNGAAWNPFSSCIPGKSSLRRAPIPPLVPPLRSKAHSTPQVSSTLFWSESSPLECPYELGVSLPVGGSVYELKDSTAHLGDNTVKGTLVVCDKNNLAVAALWNPEIEELDFPRFQDDREENPGEFDKLCRVGKPFLDWMAALKLSVKSGAIKPATGSIGGIDRLPGLPAPVVVCNGLQSNFLAPYDFVVADGKVVRQAYAVLERPFDRKGSWCWAMQLAGEGGPRMVSLCVAEGDDIIGQAKDTLIPGGLLSEPLDDSHHIEGQHPLYPEGGSSGITIQRHTVEEGVSGLPILINGKPVTCGVTCKQDGRRLAPNQVLWDPEATRAAFTAIGSKDGSIVIASVVEELTVAELAQVLKGFGVEDAILLGGSGDVNMWVNGETSHGFGEEALGGRWIHGGARQGGTRRGMFKPGHRPLNCLVMGYLR